ncbi:MAG: hypothetical protein AVDCRST_MAG79-571, partial [uncultured Thermoleophilia bacterium]
VASHQRGSPAPARTARGGPRDPAPRAPGLHDRRAQPPHPSWRAGHRRRRPDDARVRRGQDAARRPGVAVRRPGRPQARAGPAHGRGVPGLRERPAARARAAVRRDRRDHRRPRRPRGPRAPRGGVL